MLKIVAMVNPFTGEPKEGFLSIAQAQATVSNMLIEQFAAFSWTSKVVFEDGIKWLKITYKQKKVKR